MENVFREVRGVIIKLIFILTSFSLYAGETELKRMTYEMIKTIEAANNQIKKNDKVFSPCLNKETVKKVTPLTKPRKISLFIKKFFSDAKISLPTNFEESISIGIRLNSLPMGNPLTSYISSVYNTNKWSVDVGLYSHPMCETVDNKLSLRNSTIKI